MVTNLYTFFLHQTVTKTTFIESYEHMTKIKDQDCIQQIVAGNTQLFATLVNRYKDLVYTLALRMIKNKEEAEEITQDTFIKAFKSLQKFKGDSKFSTWIYKIAYNTCLDKLKKVKRQQNTVVSISVFTAHHITSLDNAFESMVKTEREQAVKKCIELLPSEDSFLVSLYYFEDLSLDEIAAIVGIKPNYVKVKLFRIRTKLMSILKQRLSPEIIGKYEQRIG